MKKKIKLRDMTYEQYKKWYFTKCNGMECKNCPFKFVFCNEDKDYCWVNHKEMFSDKFLNQEIEIDVKPNLTENDRKLLETLRDVFKCDSIGITLASDKVQCAKDNKIVLYFHKDFLNCYEDIFNPFEVDNYFLPRNINDLLKESEENEE